MPAATAQDSPSARILVVDDNADMLAYIHRILGDQYAVDTAEDGVAALDKLKTALPDLVLTDVMMPRLDGFGLIAAIRSNPQTASLPVIVLSARAGEESKAEGFESGADDYIVKPFPASELVARVQAQVHAAAVRREAAAQLKKTTERLAQQVTEFETLFREVPVGIGVARDPSCDFIRINPAFANILGIDPQRNASLSGAGADAPAFRIYSDGVEVPPRDLPMQVAAREGVAVRDVELDVLREDGQLVRELMHAVPLFDENGAVRGSIAMCLDITERKRAEEALREREHQLRLAVERVGLGVWIWDAANDRILEAQNVQAMFNLAGAPQSSAEVLAAIHPEDRPAVKTALARLVKENVPLDVEFRIPLPDGRTRWLSSLAARLDQGDPASRIGGFNIDITSRKQGEELLSRANRDLERFAYMASHDLQEPLRAVSSYADLLARRCRDSLDEQGLHFLDVITGASGRMATLINNLLMFARSGAQDPGAMVDAPAGAALHTALGNLQSTIEEAGAIVSADPLPAVRAEPGQLALVFQNLIGNAIKYRKDGAAPEVAVSAVRDGSDWIFAVRDNGIGFDAAFAEKIFDPFQRLHGRDRSGNGLGLAIVRRTIESFGGHVWAKSWPGDGSVFCFTLPAVEEILEADPPPVGSAGVISQGVQIK
jgi:PAS domain S-box-containing protein